MFFYYKGERVSLKLFYECNFFQEELDNIKSSFSVFQKELLLKNYSNGKASFKKNDVEYKCHWHKQEDWDKNRPTLLIPIRDNKNLLSITIRNLFQHNINRKANIIIIDDRSEIDIKTLVLEKKISYLRVDNSKGFNFSMLNNIAAKLCYHIGSREIILWNSDLWVVKEKFFDDLLNKHRNNESKISGSKLVYPPAEMSLGEDLDTENIKKTFPHMAGQSWRNTIQFGGSVFLRTPNSPIIFSPFHYKRFADIEDSRVNCDRGTEFITGALQIYDAKYFIEIGGLNPSLSKNFQDVDICLRSCANGHVPMYFGKDIYFYHDESANFHSSRESKEDMQMLNDHVLFSKIWNDKITSIVL